LALLFILIPTLAGSFISPNEGEPLPEWLATALAADRRSLLKNDSFRSLVFILSGTGVLLAFLFEKLKKGFAISILSLLFIFDMWIVDKRYLNTDNFEKRIAIDKTSAPTKADAYILKDTSYFRVLNLTVSPFQDASTSRFHNSIGGYHGAKMRKYQELADTSIFKEISQIYEVARKAKTIEYVTPVLSNLNALNMLNTKYIILDPNVPPLVNFSALGNAWFAETPILVDNANKEISEINKFNPSKQAVINLKFKNQITKLSYPISENDKIELVSHKSDELFYKYTSQGERLVVFSEIYYPAGWKASIDGNEKSYFQTNYVLRGMIVPGGTHDIRFVFKPESYYIGNKISLASSVIFILLFVGYIIVSSKKKIKG
jgi:hypothetical protein